MILVDSNILMYAAGLEHPNKASGVRFLDRVAAGAVPGAVDAEVLQEILHRYRAIGRWTQGRLVYDLARQIFPLVIPITAAIMDRARSLMDDHAELMARDALHAAVVEDHAFEAICSYDTDFDKVTSIRRIEPER